VEDISDEPPVRTVQVCAHDGSDPDLFSVKGRVGSCHVKRMAECSQHDTLRKWQTETTFERSSDPRLLG
jgi:hypothetical protein